MTTTEKVTTCEILDLQVYRDDELGDIAFVDQKQHHHATKAKARDITIMSPQVSDEDQKRLAEDIAVDIAINQGHNPVGIRRNI